MFRKSFIIRVATILGTMALLAHASPAAAFSGPGSGTAEDPYLVSTIGQLDEVRNALGAHYRLVADIDAMVATGNAAGEFWNGGAGWLPIGSQTYPLRGTFDGNGHEISDLYLVRTLTAPDSSYTPTAGLFGYIWQTGVVQDLNRTAPFARIARTPIRPGFGA